MNLTKKGIQNSLGIFDALPHVLPASGQIAFTVPCTFKDSIESYGFY